MIYGKTDISWSWEALVADFRTKSYQFYTLLNQVKKW